MMISQPVSGQSKTSQTKPNDLAAGLAQIGLRVTAHALNDFIARATTGGWSPHNLLEEIVRSESLDRTRRSLDRRLRFARLGRFKPLADFDWNWPSKIDRQIIESALTLDFIKEARNLILFGPNGLGKTLLTKNIAYAAILAGHTVIFRTASELISDLSSDSPVLRRSKLAYYSRPSLLCIDEVGYLSYDSNAADILFQIVNRRYERSSILITTNRAFREWNTVFPNATCIAALLDRLTHHADLTAIEGDSYRVRESELESAARKHLSDAFPSEEKQPLPSKKKKS
jgi:DNA replication protein DnaC